MGRTPLLSGDPAQVGDYWLAGRLGAGGQGVVYEAYDPAGVRVALKLLTGTRTEKEATATRRVASFCTARVIDVGSDAAGPYIVSEYVDGPSLRQALREPAGSGVDAPHGTTPTGNAPHGPTPGSNPPHRAVFGGDGLYRLAIGIATALGAIHQAGVVHRDLKPENVLLGPDGPRVIDFGIARTEDMSLTASREVAGTPRYMAPELLHGGRAGQPADVYGWGAVVLFAATGHDPFEGEHLGYVMNQVLTTEPDVSVLAEPLRTLVAAALRKNPDARPSAEALLRGLLGGEVGDLSAICERSARRERPVKGEGSAGGEESAEVALLAAGSRAAKEVHPPEGSATADPALEALAEQAYADLDEAARQLAPQLLLRLVNPLTNAEDVLRTANMEELLTSDDPDTADRVMRAFAHLLARDGDTVTLATPAILRAWPRLRNWVDADRDGLRLHHGLSDAARLWRDSGTKPADLYQGTPLERVLEWGATGRSHVTLNEVERTFLSASVAYGRARTRRRRLLTATLAVLLVISLGAVAFANQQRLAVAAERATVTRQLKEALARRLPLDAAAIRATAPTAAMLLSAAAHRLASGLPEVRAGLYGSLSQRELSAFTAPTKDASFYQLEQGNMLFADDPAKPYGVHVWNLDTGRHTTIAADGQPKTGLTMSPDGSTVAIENRNDGIHLWSLPSGKKLGSTSGILPDFNGSNAVLPVHRNIFALELWDPHTRKLLFSIGGNPSGLKSPAAVSPDARFVVYAMAPERRAKLLDLRTGKTRPLPGKENEGRKANGVYAAAFSPDGRLLVSTDGHTMSVLEVATGKTPVLEKPVFGLAELVFSADGRFIAGLTSSSRVHLWTVGGEEIMRHQISGTTESLAFGPGDRTLRLLADQSTAITLDISRLTHPPLVRRGATSAGPLSQDGRFAVAWTRRGASMDLTVTDRGADVQGVGMTIKWPEGYEPPPSTVSADGRRLAVAVADPPSVAVWDLPARRLIGSVPIKETAHSGAAIWGVALSPDGRALATSTGFMANVQVWDLATMRLTRSLPEAGGSPLTFAPDGRRVLAARGPYGVVDLKAGTVIDAPESRKAPMGEVIAFHPDGKSMAVSDPHEGRVRFRRTADLGPFGAVLNAHNLLITAMAYSPDGTLLATADNAGKVRLWVSGSGRALGTISADHRDKVTSLAFSADGATLSSADALGGLLVHPIAPDAAAEAVCARAGRDLTADERARYLKEFPTLEVCPRA